MRQLLDVTDYLTTAKELTIAEKWRCAFDKSVQCNHIASVRLVKTLLSAEIVIGQQLT